MENNKFQTISRLLLGLFMIIVGISHLTAQGEEFQLLIPAWLNTPYISANAIVIGSGVIEILLGIGILFFLKYSVRLGILLALFFILIFPSNWEQYTHDINAFGLDTDQKRLFRLFLQPLLILWALWSTRAWSYLFKNGARKDSTSIYDYDVTLINGKTLSMGDFKGKTILIVNTASKCGLTPQYKELEQLYQQYKDQGLVILGFPCNQFAHQESGTSTEIATFCEINYGVTFPIFEKIAVNGKHTHPLFNYLKTKLPGIFTNTIKWNFTKFLIDRNGHPVKRFAPFVKPSKIEPFIREMTEI